MLIRSLPWVAAVATVALWVPALARVKVPPFLEVAFFQGGLLLPIVGALLAFAALRTRPRAAPAAALVVNVLLALAYLAVVSVPIS